MDIEIKLKLKAGKGKEIILTNEEMQELYFELKRIYKKDAIPYIRDPIYPIYKFDENHTKITWSPTATNASYKII